MNKTGFLLSQGLQPSVQVTEPTTGTESLPRARPYAECLLLSTSPTSDKTLCEEGEKTEAERGGTHRGPQACGWKSWQSRAGSEPHGSTACLHASIGRPERATLSTAGLPVLLALLDRSQGGKEGSRTALLTPVLSPTPPLPHLHQRLHRFHRPPLSPARCRLMSTGTKILPIQT